jgi:hypothetical protein
MVSPWIDGAGAGSNMRREDKRAEEGESGRGDDTREMEEEKKKEERNRENRGLRYTTFSAARSRRGAELLASGSMLLIQPDSTFSHSQSRPPIDLSEREIRSGNLTGEEHLERKKKCELIEFIYRSPVFESIAASYQVSLMSILYAAELD